MHPRTPRRTVRTLAATVSVGLAVAIAAAGGAPSASADGGMGGKVHIGPTGNKVEMAEPAKSTYIPKTGRASDRDRTKAKDLLAGVRNFCQTHTAADIKAKWRPAGSSASTSTHFFNPHPAKSSGLHPRRPRAALIYDGRLRGVMFSGKPLPYLGMIPRAHGHDMKMDVEMLHVYCTKNLRDAFTPNRMLGINADLVKLRWKIRPAVMDLGEKQLRTVRDKIRGYTNSKAEYVAGRTSDRSGPDPVLEALRTEIRQSVWDLSEGQLRSVWRLMKSYIRS